MRNESKGLKELGLDFVEVIKCVLVGHVCGAYV